MNKNKNNGVQSVYVWYEWVIIGQLAQFGGVCVTETVAYCFAEIEKTVKNVQNQPPTPHFIASLFRTFFFETEFDFPIS